MEGYHRVSTRDWYLMLNSNSSLTGGRNTHTQLRNLARNHSLFTRLGCTLNKMSPDSIVLRLDAQGPSNDLMLDRVSLHSIFNEAPDLKI
jgi:hypothetical protein